MFGLGPVKSTLTWYELVVISLVSTVVDRDTQEKIDVVKNRMIRNYRHASFAA